MISISLYTETNMHVKIIFCFKWWCYNYNFEKINDFVWYHICFSYSEFLSNSINPVKIHSQSMTPMLCECFSKLRECRSKRNKKRHLQTLSKISFFLQKRTFFFFFFFEFFSFFHLYIWLYFFFFFLMNFFGFFFFCYLPTRSQILWTLKPSCAVNTRIHPWFFTNENKNKIREKIFFIK